MRRRNRPLLVSLAIACFVIGAIALVNNLRSTFNTLEIYPNASFWNVFLSTQGATGADPILVFFVWGPFVLGALGVALLIAHFAMRAVRAGAVVAVGAGAAAGAQGWQQPQQQGWQPTQQQSGWQQQQQQQGGWQPQPASQPQQAGGWQPEQQQTWQQSAEPGQAPSAPQPDGMQPPPPNAGDRIQP